MKIKSITKTSEKYDECDITTSTENFYIYDGNCPYLIHNSPAIVFGVDTNNKFFVASKSAFNKNPKINYTPEDIEKHHGHAPGLVEKLKLALRYLPALEPKGIYQADYMFDKELKHMETPQTIDGVANRNKFLFATPSMVWQIETSFSRLHPILSSMRLRKEVHMRMP